MIRYIPHPFVEVQLEGIDPTSVFVLDDDGMLFLVGENKVHRLKKGVLEELKRIDEVGYGSTIFICKERGLIPKKTGQIHATLLSSDGQQYAAVHVQSTYHCVPSITEDEWWNGDDLR